MTMTTTTHRHQPAAATSRFSIDIDFFYYYYSTRTILCPWPTCVASIPRRTTGCTCAPSASFARRSQKRTAVRARDKSRTHARASASRCPTRRTISTGWMRTRTCTCVFHFHLNGPAAQAAAQDSAAAARRARVWARSRRGPRTGPIRSASPLRASRASSATRSTLRASTSSTAPRFSTSSPTSRASTHFPTPASPPGSLDPPVKRVHVRIEPFADAQLRSIFDAAADRRRAHHAARRASAGARASSSSTRTPSCAPPSTRCSAEDTRSVGLRQRITQGRAPERQEPLFDPALLPGWHEGIDRGVHGISIDVLSLRVAFDRQH
jgi:hypothetical protein